MIDHNIYLPPEGEDKDTYLVFIEPKRIPKIVWAWIWLRWFYLRFRIWRLTGYWIPNTWTKKKKNQQY